MVEGTKSKEKVNIESWTTTYFALRVSEARNKRLIQRRALWNRIKSEGHNNRPIGEHGLSFAIRYGPQPLNSTGRHGHF